MKNTKTLFSLLSAILFLQLCEIESFAQQDKNPFSLTNPNEITKEDILDAKNVILDNKDTLLEMGASIYAVSTYVTPFDGQNPSGWGAGLGLNFPLDDHIEFQGRAYWTNDDSNGGSTWLGDAGVAYRFSMNGEPMPIDIYSRAFIGYKGVPDADFYAGVGFGIEIPISQKSNFIIEPSLLFGFDAENAVGISGGFSWEF